MGTLMPVLFNALLGSRYCGILLHLGLYIFSPLLGSPLLQCIMDSLSPKDTHFLVYYMLL